jgi:transposase
MWCWGGDTSVGSVNDTARDLDFVDAVWETLHVAITKRAGIPYQLIASRGKEQENGELIFGLQFIAGGLLRLWGSREGCTVNLWVRARVEANHTTCVHFVSSLMPPSHLDTRRHYSKDLKEQVIYQRLTLGKSTTEIAKDLDMSLRIIQRVLKVYEEIGEVVKDPKMHAKWGKAKLLDTHCVEVSHTLCNFVAQGWQHYEFMRALIAWQPGIYLDEIAEQLTEQLNISVSLSTIQRLLKLLGITSKKVCTHILTFVQSSHFVSFPKSLLRTVRSTVKTFCGKLVRNLHGDSSLETKVQ